MYSSRGSNAYGQDQPYSSQSSYTPQSLGGAALLGGGVHGRPSSAGTAPPPPQRYGEEYSSTYGSATQQQISSLGMKGSAPTAFEGRVNYGSSMPESPKFTANDYVTSSSRGYGLNVDQLYPDRTAEYPSVERRQYADRAYLGRDLHSETANRYAESVAFGHEHQSKLYDRLEQTTVLRQDEIRNAHALQSASVEGGARQAGYLAPRAGVRHPAQDPIAYGGRHDPELHNLSMLTGSSYSGNHNTSILGAAPHRNLDDLIYAQSSTIPGYGVSLPPGRDYGVGKGLHGTTLESDYPASILGRAGHLLDDRKDDRATYSRELERRDKELDHLREREKDREWEKDRMRERERDRERKREREREREREKERERREKDRDREHKRKLELKCNPTPPRVSRDRRASSSAKDIRSLRRESPHPSPVREKRREYSCKVFSFSFVESERDYLSLDKRYSRLYVSPECSKVVLFWLTKNLRLSLHTPISFEHDIVEAAAAERKESPSSQPVMDMSGAGGQTTIWNAKVILMSGLGQNALADLSSERTYNDRIPHFGNLLRFAVLKKSSSLMAIGGPWNTVDGGDPSVDESSLIQTSLRYAKDIANLDLKNCRHWNRFLEIHYDRVGKDGLFSHKEVTVLYVPDLSGCLPSMESWREQWFNHKKTISEREHMRGLKKEVSGDKKEGLKDNKKVENSKDSKAKSYVQNKKEVLSSDQSGDDLKKENDASKLNGKATIVADEGKEKNKAAENKDVVVSTEEEKIVLERFQEGNPDAQPAVTAKTGKKKIIKRIVKRKVVKRKDGTENATTELNDKIAKLGAEGSNIISEAVGQQDGSSSNPPAVKTFILKKVVKKLVNDAAVENGESSVLESAADNEKVKSEDSNEVVVQECSTKTTVKKKIIKRVPKRKAPLSDKLAEDEPIGEKIIHPEDIKGGQSKEAVEKETNEVKKEEAGAGEKQLSGSAMETDSANQKVSQNDDHAKSKENKELKTEKEGKDLVESESKIQTNKAVNEKKRRNELQTANDKKKSDDPQAPKEKRSEEPPKHPGLILQTKGNKSSKLQSLSFSLDSLLDYTDKDIEESTFELSVFAESFYEMLQYEMGCRLLAFLQILRIKFVAKRIEGKRQREESSRMENEESSSKKRSKSGNTNEDVKPAKPENKPDSNTEHMKSTKSENTNDAHQGEDKPIKEETKSPEQVDMSKIDDEIEEDPEEDPEEDLEEDPEEDEQMLEDSPQHDSAKDENIDAEKNAGDSIGQDVSLTEQNEKQDAAKQIPVTIISNPDQNNKNQSHKVESKPKEAPRVVNKELLQAFRFFDRNRVGFVRVDDLRLILHNLGKFLSHRDVKELVQSALFESNTGRDDRILYEKLVKMSDIQ